jgi:hypothetical protein
MAKEEKVESDFGAVSVRTKTKADFDTRTTMHGMTRDGFMRALLNLWSISPPDQQMKAITMAGGTGPGGDMEVKKRKGGNAA